MSDLTCWVERIDINTEINWLGSANAFMDLLNYAIHSNRVNLSCFHNFKPTVSIILIIAHAAQSGSNPSVDIAVVREQPFLRSMVEVRAMIDASNLAWGAPKDLWLPCIKM